MTDLETRLSEALHDAAAGRPVSTDLATGARARLRRRRRTTAAAVAAAVAVVAIPVGLQLAAPDRTAPAPADPTAGWRVESFRDLTLKVPPSWGHGSGIDWCAEEEPAPQVSRPSALGLENERCTPAYGYGVVFREESLDIFTDETFPDEAFYTTLGTPEARVWIAAESQEQLDAIVASIRTNETTDDNGCPARREDTGDLTRPDERVTLCRYGSDGLLEQSELLSAAGSDALRDAVRDAPGASADLCPRADERATTVSMFSRGFGYYATLDHPCAGLNVLSDDDATEVQLTEGILYWALSPGFSGTLDGSLPRPDQIRDR